MSIQQTRKKPWHSWKTSLPQCYVSTQWRTQKISEEGAKFHHNRVTSQINFRTTIVGGSGTPRENFAKFCIVLLYCLRMEAWVRIPLLTPCIVAAQTVKVKTRVHSKSGTRSTRQPRHQLTPQIWCVQQRLIASRLRLETLRLLRSDGGAIYNFNKIAQKIAVHATTCGRCSAVSFKFIYVLNYS